MDARSPFGRRLTSSLVLRRFPWSGRSSNKGGRDVISPQPREAVARDRPLKHRCRDFPWSALGRFQEFVIMFEGECYFAEALIKVTDAYQSSRN